MQHNQTNIQFQFLLKSDSDIWYDGTSDKAATKRVTCDTGYPLDGPVDTSGILNELFPQRLAINYNSDLMYLFVFYW